MIFIFLVEEKFLQNQDDGCMDDGIIFYAIFLHSIPSRSFFSEDLKRPKESGKKFYINFSFLKLIRLFVEMKLLIKLLVPIVIMLSYIMILPWMS